MFYFLAVIALILDQFTKWLAVRELTFQRPVEVTSFFNLFLTYNKGVSFSLFASDSVYTPILLSIFALSVCVFIAYWLYKETDPFIKAGLALILGGALGNVIDRIRFASVVDFIDIYYHTYHWPAFNIADSAICLGAGLMLIKIFKKKEKK